MLRIIIGVICGAVVGVLVVAGVEFAGHSAFPPPPGLDFSTPEAARESVRHLPAAAIASVGVAWGLAALAGGYVAARIGRRAWAAWIIAALLFAAALFNLISIPSPIWLWIGGLAAIVAGGWFAGKLGAPARET
ncbi:MAG: hypothetical protein AB7O98_14475 [Hyphomonadaceae bacterium]